MIGSPDKAGQSRGFNQGKVAHRFAKIEKRRFTDTVYRFRGFLPQIDFIEINFENFVLFIHHLNGKRHEKLF